MTCLAGKILFLTLLGTPLQVGTKTDSKGITFAAPAARTEMLFPGLSKVLGIRLEASPQTANEVLLIQVKDVTEKDLLAKIAKVADAEWKQDNGILRLVRPAS